MMRVGFFTTLIIGSLMCLAAIGAIFLSLSGAESLALSGSGMITGSSFAKAIQKKWEEKAD